MKLAKITYALKHGLFIQRFKIWLGRRLSFRFFPYYLIEEGMYTVEPAVREPTGYEVRMFTAENLNEDIELGSSVDTVLWQRRFQKGDICVALVKSGVLAAYCWADTNEFNFRPQTFRLGATEAYLYDAYTEDAFRGQGLAPYMRLQCYRTLKTQGYDRFLSVSDYFNASTHKFKKKLNARIVRLCLKIDIQNKEVCHCVIRNYAK